MFVNGASTRVFWGNVASVRHVLVLKKKNPVYAGKKKIDDWDDLVGIFFSKGEKMSSLVERSSQDILWYYLALIMMSAWFDLAPRLFVVG